MVSRQLQATQLSIGRGEGHWILVVRLFVCSWTHVRQLVGVGIGAAAEEAVVMHAAQMVERDGQTCGCLRSEVVS